MSIRLVRDTQLHLNYIYRKFEKHQSPTHDLTNLKKNHNIIAFLWVCNWPRWRCGLVTRPREWGEAADRFQVIIGGCRWQKSKAHSLVGLKKVRVLIFISSLWLPPLGLWLIIENFPLLMFLISISMSYFCLVSSRLLPRLGRWWGF